jgi:selenocysteine-specific elongation factor
MTIDLGFGWLTLPGGREVGLVDVPGHRDFVENMLAGVAGIDAVWLVVAADEGVMPQTREHLAIINLLAIRGGVLILTKADLVRDADWLEAVESDLRSEARGTTLEQAPIIRVSARTGEGLPDLLDCTAALLDALPPRPDLSRPRLPIDRVFSMDGFGTVVTGTLTDGALALGDEIEVLPSGQRGRIRGLQHHGRQINSALPGSRTAVNVAGIPAESLRRGEVLTHPGQYAATRRVDARIRLLPEASTSLTHDLEAKLFIGASETMARVRLLGTELLKPGEQGWIQLEAQEPVVCARGDAFILRLPSPPETLGGGLIVDSHPGTRHKRHDQALIETLHALAAGRPADILLETAMALGPAPARELVERSRLAPEEAPAALGELVSASKLVPLEAGAVTINSETFLATARQLDTIGRKIERAIAAYHARFPLRQGMPREELRNQLELEARPFQAILEHLQSSGGVAPAGGLVALRGHQAQLTPSQRTAADALIKKFEASPGAPPSIKECIEEVGAELFAALKEQGTLVPVSADVVFSKARYDHMLRTIKAELDRRGQVTLADVRDTLGTSRRYAQALLEHLDRIGVTRRIGDVRTLAPGATSGSIS